jgi:hypothetical protein
VSRVLSYPSSSLLIYVESVVLSELPVAPNFLVVLLSVMFT